jgi:hypothetical protein
MASAMIGSSPRNVLLYRVKEVYGSGAEGIEYAGSLQVGGIVGIVCFVMPETHCRDGTLHCSRNHPVSLQMDRQDTDMKGTHQNITIKLCLASHSILRS